jgi:nicotinate-nucleotide adenylyltransferase
LIASSRSNQVKGTFLKGHLERPRSTWLRPPGPVARGLRIGLLGGSFNPAHEGHVHVSEVALKRLGLDYVWWLVAPQNPLKSVVGMAPLHGRMADAVALARHPRIIVMDIEHALGTRYTVDTVRALKKRFPQLCFVWLMGSDNLDNFKRWYRWPEILSHIPVAIVLRPGSVLAALHAKPIERFASARRHHCSIARARAPAIAIIDGRRNSQSSTAIRAALAPREAMVDAIPPC